MERKRNLNSDLVVKNLTPESKQYYCTSDSKAETGFGVLVYPSGSKTFVYKYKIDGQQRLLVLGEYPTTSLKDARSAYQKAAVKIKDLRKGSKDGIDPALEKKLAADKRISAQEEQRNAVTVTKLIEEYISKHAKAHKRSWQEDERILHKELLNEEKLKSADEWTKRKEKSKFDWSDRKAADITKRDIVLLLESIIERGAPIMSNLTFAVIRKMLNFAVERDILPYSPASGIKMLAPKVARERVLTEQEIKTLWDTLDNAAMTDEIRRALKLILVTAQRSGEVIGIHTSEIEQITEKEKVVGTWWTIPKERSKNKKAHRVYLTGTALDLIGSLKKIDAKTGKVIDKGFIFPTPLSKKIQSIDEKALSRAIRNNLAVSLLDEKRKPLFTADGKPATENRLAVDHFTPHDLRRTAATFMAQSGELDEVIDAVLNHSKQGVIKVYNQYRYDKEKQMALESWERKLNSIVNGEASGKIVSIQQSRKRVENG